MEINCPQCDQRLRVPDSMKNPLLGCKKCGARFRKQDAVAANRKQSLENTSGQWFPPAPTEPARVEPRWTPSPPTATNAEPWLETAPVEVVEEESLPQLERRPAPSLSEKTKSMAGSSLGTVILFLVIILFKGGPRLAQMFFRDRQQQQPPPVQMDQQRLEQLRKMQRDAVRRVRENQQRQKDAEAPAVE